MNRSDGQPGDHFVHVHSHIGDVDGLIVEIRESEHDHASGRDMDHLTDSDARGLLDQLNKALKPHSPDTKIIRVHEPDQGRYVFVMMTRFNGSDAPLGEFGWGGDYIQYSIVTQNKESGVCGTDPWSIARRHPSGWFPDSNASQLMKDLEMERTEWGDLRDGMKLTPEDVDRLSGRGGDD